MPELYRAFVYILIVSLPALYVAQLCARTVVGPAEIRVWRNCWFVATCALFLSGNIFFYCVAIAAVAVYAHRSSTAPYCLFAVVLLTGPTVGVNLGIPGLFESIIEFTPARLFTVAFLLPTAVRLMRSPRRTDLTTADKVFATFVLLVTVLSARHGSLTHMLRALAVILLDIVVPYYVFSRALMSVAEVRKTLAAFLFGALPFAIAGVFEFTRGWRIYSSAIEQWGIILVQPYLFRDGMLRAAVTAVEPIAFGFTCMVAIGFLLANRKVIPTKLVFLAAMAIAGAGLIAGLSRGPWLGTAVLLALFAAMSRRGVSNLSKASLAFCLVCGTLMLMPAGERVYRLLPFVGTVEKSNEEYRTRLIDVSMTIVARNPLFGSAQFRDAPELVAMLQGQGIIDIVNTYVAIALEYGLVGMIAFMAIFAHLGFRLVGTLLRSEGEETLLLRALAGTLAAICLTIGTVSSVSFIPYIYWAFAGLCAAVLRMPRTAAAVVQHSLPPSLTVLGRSDMFDRAGWRR